MPEGQPKSALSLRNLLISGFRGIDALTISRLGRVTLLAGKNGVGKTTVLEACQVFAARGHHSALSELMSRHEEFSSDIDDDGDEVPAPNLSALFYGRGAVPNACIEIGPEGSPKNRLRIDIVTPNVEEAARLEGVVPNDIADGDLRVLKAIFQGHEHVVSSLFSSDDWSPIRLRNLRSSRAFRHLSRQDQPAPAMQCVSLGPGIMQNNEVAKIWGIISLCPQIEIRRWI